GQKLVPDVMKVADQRRAHAELEQALLDARHRRCRLVAINRDAHKLGAGARLVRGPPPPPSSRSTVMRTSSEPAPASAATCRAVASTSAVSVLVIDCTPIGAPPPTVTPPILTATVLWRCGNAVLLYGKSSASTRV